jgi:hypothetical protein
MAGDARSSSSGGRGVVLVRIVFVEPRGELSVMDIFAGKSKYKYNI